MRGRLTRTLGPTILPVTIDEMKAHARIEDDATAENGLLFGYLRAALGYLEGDDGLLGRVLNTQTWTFKLDAFPAGELRVPLPPLQSVSSIQYVDTAGDTQTWAAANYTVDTGSEPGRICPAYNVSWPQSRDVPDAVTVTFIAGYGPDRYDVPEPLRLALLQLVAHWYEQREPIITGTIVSEAPLTVERLIASYRVRGFA